MKAEIVYGKLTKVEDNKVTIEQKNGYDIEESEYTCDMALDEAWIADNLGKYLEAVVIDGKIKNFRSPE